MHALIHVTLSVINNIPFQITANVATGPNKFETYVCVYGRRGDQLYLSSED